jgi:hypothetical protein
MSLSILATVELQLILQCCDLRCLLSLARCSRFTLAAASSRFAFKFAPPLSSRCGETDLSLSVFASQMSISLIRFGSLDLVWRMPAEGEPEEDDFTTVTLLPLVRLNFVGFYVLKARHLRWITEGVQMSETIPMIKHLNLGFQCLRNDGAAELALLIPLCPHLEFLGLSTCEIGEEGAEWLGPAISDHVSLKEVSFVCNPIGRRGILALFSAIQHRLEKIWLRTCAIKDGEFAMLLSVLLCSEKMIWCNIRFNEGIHAYLHTQAIHELEANRPEIQLIA